ncbi:MAG TPA: nucleotidyltransferase domain-containing protein [Symbiobacteriaceae bacterium]|jgi:predicted nucleotidyltransferase
MPSRFQSALSQALQDLQEHPEVDGILFFGSALTGTAGPTSDLDLYVIVKGEKEGTQISLRRYSGVPAEVHRASPRGWRKLMESGRPAVINAFATGQSLLDKSGKLAELSAMARKLVEAGPPALTQEAVDRWRFRLTDLADDLEDVAGQPANERLLGAMLVSLSLEAYCELNRIWGEQPKRRLAYVERYDPDLGRMARAFFAGDLDRHLAQTVVDRVLAPHGGRMSTWESHPSTRE